MDTDGFPLGAISEKSLTDFDTPSRKAGNRAKTTPYDSSDANDNVEIRDMPMSTLAPSPKQVSTRKRNKSKPAETSIHAEQSTELKSPNANIPKKVNHVEISSITDEDDDNEREQRLNLPKSSAINTPDHETMVSSYTTGGENDAIEIHQFSLSDIDIYLDLYFEALPVRLRHYIGQDEQLQHFRTSMKNRINSNPDAREFQNVLLGKMNGEIVAAVTMSFHGETPTIPHTSDAPGQNSCLKPIRGWMTRKANYIPTNTEECYIEMIGVKKAYQKRGIGAAMLECVEHFAQQASANLLTIHVSGEQLRNYFERSGFSIDQSDSSPFWKWVVERQNVSKLSKAVSTGEDSAADYAAGSYLNDSVAESIDE